MSTESALPTPVPDDDDPPPKEPVAPDEDACCGNGCDPCVWDFYEMERERYFEAMRAWRARRESPSDSRK
jgi:hypothetical protein